MITILMSATNDLDHTTWQHCYNERWHNLITPESFAHPAKYSRGLIRKIYQLALTRKWLKPGDTVLDPFGGVGLGALDGLAAGVNWLGVELEQKFVDMGAGCDCTGMSKTEWVHFFGRWERAGHTGGRHWCPQCLSGAGQTVEPARQLSLFSTDVSGVAYVSHSGRIPSTQPHHYWGNLARFQRYAKDGARARLVRGDSRDLVEVLKHVVPATVIGSPPFAGSVGSDDPEKRGGLYRDPKRGNDRNLTGTYGNTAGQLGAMCRGEFKSVIGSPPFEASLARGHVYQAERRMSANEMDLTNTECVSPLDAKAGQYGPTPGQLHHETFWNAARQIVGQCYQVLQPGGVTIWVCKNFVRDRQVVPFCDQWRQMCEGVGFEHLETHRAMLVKDNGVQLTLDGHKIYLKTERKSFFRRLAERNGSPRIDWEAVIVLRKPL